MALAVSCASLVGCGDSTPPPEPPKIDKATYDQMWDQILKSQPNKKMWAGAAVMKVLNNHKLGPGEWQSAIQAYGYPEKYTKYMENVK